MRKTAYRTQAMPPKMALEVHREWWRRTQRHLRLHLSSHLRAGATVLDLGDAATAYLLDLGHKGIGLIELFNIVATSDALAHQ